MGYRDSKKAGSIHSDSPQTPSTKWPLSASSYKSTFSSIEELEDKDKSYKRNIRILRFISRSISFILSAFMVTTLSYALAKYYLTRGHILADNTHPWVTNATLWPTFMLLGISLVTLVMNLITLVAYCCGTKVANSTDTWATIVVFILGGVHVLAWAIAAGAFKMGNSDKALWGYSCGSQADKIQEEVKAILDFGKLCNMQGGAWYASIIEAASYLLAFIIAIMVLRRKSTKKEMKKVRQSMTMDNGYVPVELGNIHKPALGRSYIPLSGETRYA